jgi:hypothetical protein
MSEGVCAHCNTFYTHILANWHHDERGRIALEKLVAKIKTAAGGRDFDCILGTGNERKVAAMRDVYLY